MRIGLPVELLDEQVKSNRKIVRSVERRPEQPALLVKVQSMGLPLRRQINLLKRRRPVYSSPELTPTHSPLASLLEENPNVF